MTAAARENGGRRVFLQDVAMRDGLQAEAGFVATDDKVAFIDLLSRTGLAKIEVTSFTSPSATRTPPRSFLSPTKKFEICTELATSSRAANDPTLSSCFPETRRTRGAPSGRPRRF